MTLKTLVIVGTMMVVAALSTFRYRTAKSIIHIQQVLYWGALSTLPLVIGSVLYAILRVLMVLDMTSLSAALAFPYSARRGVLFEFVNSFDLFTVWFIVLFASRLAKLLHDDFLTVFTYLIVAHILAVAISFLLRVDSILSLFLK
ncbi:MAG: hypothetical protein N3A63_07325 [Bacteroidetes bacterium]|nr:hypothetical protein [Bacteroidota bacterium]